MSTLRLFGILGKWNPKGRPLCFQTPFPPSPRKLEHLGLRSSTAALTPTRGCRWRRAPTRRRWICCTACWAPSAPAPAPGSAPRCGGSSIFGFGVEGVEAWDLESGLGTSRVAFCGNGNLVDFLLVVPKKTFLVSTSMTWRGDPEEFRATPTCMQVLWCPEVSAKKMPKSRWVQSRRRDPSMETQSKPGSPISNLDSHPSPRPFDSCLFFNLFGGVLF